MINTTGITHCILMPSSRSLSSERWLSLKEEVFYERVLPSRIEIPRMKAKVILCFFFTLFFSIFIFIIMQKKLSVAISISLSLV